MAANALPLVLQTALTFLTSYLSSHAVVFGRSGARQRGMRSDRRNHILGVAVVLLRACSLQYKGLSCHYSGLWVRPLTISEIATLAKICRKTVSRCLADLVDLGLIECYQIKRRNPKTGQLEVSIGIRRFTEKFWKAIGLWDFYQKSCTWAEKNGKRQVVIPFKKISLKVKEKFSSASSLIKNVLGDLSKHSSDSQYLHDIK